jgi:hypothetical protein
MLAEILPFANEIIVRDLFARSLLRRDDRKGLPSRYAVIPTKEGSII